MMISVACAPDANASKDIAFMQEHSGQCPDRRSGTAPELRSLLEAIYPAMVMNIATDNVDGGNITVRLTACCTCSSALKQAGKPRWPNNALHLLRLSSLQRLTVFAWHSLLCWG